MVHTRQGKRAVYCAQGWNMALTPSDLLPLGSKGEAATMEGGGSGGGAAASEAVREFKFLSLGYPHVMPGLTGGGGGGGGAETETETETENKKGKGKGEKKLLPLIFWRCF